MKWLNGWSAAATFEGEFSDVTAATPARAWCDTRGERLSKHGAVFYAVTLSSLSAPRMTILNASSGKGRRRMLTSFHGARIHTSHSSSVVRITGVAFGWIGSMGHP